VALHFGRSPKALGPDDLRGRPGCPDDVEAGRRRLICHGSLAAVHADEAARPLESRSPPRQNTRSYLSSLAMSSRIALPQTS
jgi:hypothetical protein